MAGVLDTDVATLLPLARRGLEWWLDELADLARPLLRERGARGLRTVAAPQADGRYALVRDGVVTGFAAPDRPVQAAVLMAPEQALVCGTAAARLSRRDWLKLVENDIDRLTPFAAADVYAAVRLLPDQDGWRTAELAVAPRARAEAALRLAGAAGVRPDALLVETPDGGALDLLPALRAAGAFGRPRRGVRLWSAVVVLVALNLAAAVWRDVRDTDRLQAEVDRWRPVALRVVALRARVLGDARRRRTVLERRAQGAPLQALAAATRALPDGAFVERLSLQDGQLRLAGHHRPGVDVLAALQREAAFASVRNASADLGASSPDPALGEPFDVVAGLRGAPAKPAP